MFEDEAGFGRISTPAYCWCEKGICPSVPCHHIREYDYVFGAVSPADGRKFFLILPQCNMVCMNTFLHELSEYFSGSVILLICDNAYMNDRRDGQKPSRGQYGVGRRGVGTPDGAEGPSQPDRTVQRSGRETDLGQLRRGAGGAYTERRSLLPGVDRRSGPGDVDRTAEGQLRKTHKIEP